MRSLHRILALFAAMLMLYLGTTGALMQVLDLWTLYSGAPENNAGMLSIDEGMFGDPDYAVLSVHDLTAPILPAGLDTDAALAAAFAAMAQGDAGGQPPPRLVELRMADGVPVVQAGTTSALHAFTLDGKAAPASMRAMPDYPPPSLRQQLKELHRFWSTHDVPGVWAELGAGCPCWLVWRWYTCRCPGW